jgi:drug/metabolite transporter (DMT)-like permease
MTPRQLAALLFLGGAWGASFLFIRVAAPVLGPFPLMAGRVCIAASALWLFARVRGTPVLLRPYWPRLLLLGLVHAALPFALIATAEIHLTASMAAVLIAAQPLFAALIEGLGLGEPISTRRGSGVLLGLGGVAILVGWTPGGLDGTMLRSVAASLIGALAYAAGGIYARRRLHDAPPLTLALGQQLGAAVWLIPPALVFLPETRATPVAIAAMLTLALLCTAVAYVIFFWLLSEVGAVRAFTVTYVIPVFGVLWGVLALGERPSVGMAAGTAVIVLSLMLVNEAKQAPVPASMSRRAV